MTARNAHPLPRPPPPPQEVIKLLVSAQAHLGTKNVDSKMQEYVWRRRADGLQILDVSKTWEKIQLAARVIVSIESPADVIAISARPYAQRAVLKYASHTGAQSIAGRYTPGTFTNQITKQFKEPRLLIVTDPRVDHQPVKEASFVGIPVIAFCDSDSPLKFVDIAIPANNKGQHSIGLLYWLLAREVLRLRGTIDRAIPWDVAVDLFFYRDPEELKALEEKEKSAREAEAAPPAVAYDSAAVEPAAYDATEPVAEYGAMPEGFTAVDANAGWAAGDAATGNWGAAMPAGGAFGAPAPSY